MRYRRLGKTDLQISVVAMGCWAIGDARFWGAQDERQSLATLHAALESGINFFDSAETYGSGDSEKLIGKAFAGMRDKVVLGSKAAVDHLAPSALKLACECSLKRLRTDYIDVYSIHWPNRNVPIQETLKALEDLKHEGKIRMIGCCNFGQRDLTELLQYGRVEVNQLPYSLLWRAIEFEILPICVRNQVSVSCYSPLLEGLLTGKFESAEQVPVERARTRHFSSSRKLARHVEPGLEAHTFETVRRIRDLCKRAGVPMAQAALAWLLKQDGVTGVIVGARSPEQILSNAEGASLELPDALMTALSEVTGPLKSKLGAKADPWQSESRIR